MTSCFLLQSLTEVRWVDMEPLMRWDEGAVDKEEASFDDEMDMDIETE